jgi:hypothetical protein
MPIKKKINKTQAILKHLRAYRAISMEVARARYESRNPAMVIHRIKKHHLKENETIIWNENKKTYRYYET